MIRDSLIKWGKVTENIIFLLQDNDQNFNDDVIQKVEHLLDKREGFKKTILPPFTENELVLGQELLELEKNLDTMLKYYLHNIHKELEINHKKKVSVNAYLNPYNNVFRDGTFYDKKN